MDLQKLFDVTGRSAVVTGGASGIGFAYADILSDQGSNVTLLDRNPEKLDQALAKLAGRAGTVRGGVCDVTDADSVRAAFEAAAASQNGIDIVFANAGIGPELPGSIGFDGAPVPEGDIESYDFADWRRVLDVNLNGVFLTAREAARHMTAKGAGRLIITSSEAAIKNSVQIGTPYMVSKAAVAHFMRNLALELAPHGITVNAIAPGTFETDIAGGALHDPAVQQMIGATVPLKRIGHVDELKSLALYLASSASSYMTGAHIVIDGGVTLL
jgi:NAD(P)-dependent dehydrogenase (short-subunit alcohol dehydrogenase family)